MWEVVKNFTIVSTIYKEKSSHLSKQQFKEIFIKNVNENKFTV